MEAKQTYTQKEIEAGAAFVARMLPALMQGVSFEQAARDVLERDKKLYQIATSKTEQGALIRSHLADRVFERANVINDAKKQERIAADEKRIAIVAELEKQLSSNP